MILREADEAEKIERDLLGHAAWGMGLTREQFVARETRLRCHPWSREGMTTWVLVEGPSGRAHVSTADARHAESAGVGAGQGDEILASCETFRVESAIRLEPHGPLIEGESRAIASVFVDERLRRRGHAETLVNEVVRSSDERRAQSVILFSEVGTALYGRSGFTAAPRRSVTLTPLPGDPSAVVDTMLTEAAVLERTGASPWPATAGFHVRASSSQLDWHLERERFYTSLLRARRPAFHGAFVGDAWTTWVFSPKRETLVVLRMNGDVRDDELAALVEAARRTAGACGAAHVELWAEDVPSASLASALVATSGAPVDPYDTVPMIHALDPRIVADSWSPSRSVWV